MRMFKTAADYDNVVIGPNAQVTLFSDNFDSIDSPENWVAERRRGLGGTEAGMYSYSRRLQAAPA